MEVSNGSDQSKPESGSWRASAVVKSIKALEDVRAFVFGNTGPGVTHLRDRLPVSEARQMLTVAPLGVWRNAFSIRLTNSWASSSRSPRT